MSENWRLFQKWTIRKITFVGILIAISVVFVIICASLIPIVSVPSYKISFIGLPVKITGFIFGPIVGGTVGLVADLLSFIFVPNIYNPFYTVATAVDGIIAGLVGLLFLRLFKYYFDGTMRDSVLEVKISRLFNRIARIKLKNPYSRRIKKIEDRILYAHEKRKKIRIVGTRNTLLNFYGVISTLLLAVLVFFIVWLIGFKIPQSALDGGIVKSRLWLTLLMCSGYSAMILFVWISRFAMKSKHFMIIIPIIIFSAFIELINVPLLSFADTIAYGSEKNSIFIYIFNHTLFSPVKVWFNMLVIYFTYNVINPLINKNNGIMWK
ncbi:ECF transporter S component [Mycoplasmopsis columbinasalis]|uniref:Folate ECF transporter S component FolT n=1 Tax=Mycoplasmopsis columbinasalis TaxID=114880 RepID=A0A449BAX5_9BACT|nr:ECF transporter S component [Mycoplasmopsis columbinasalis]VEU78187.1 Uncharacterised protein [Mycoplasmopsis columbinasalis]